MKKYLFYSFKRKLPLYIIVMVIFLTIALTSFATTSFFAERYYDSYSGQYYAYYGYNSGTLPLLIAYFVILFVLPFFNMGYCYSLAKSDTFRQAPFKDKHLRYYEHLSSLIIVLITFTIAFLTLFLGLLIKNYTETYEMSHYTAVPSPTAEKVYFNYIYFLPLYFLAIFFGVIQYFSSYLLISRSNNFLNSLIILFIGQLGLTVVIPLFISLLYDVGLSILMSNPMMFPIYYLYNQFDQLIVHGMNGYETTFNPTSIGDTYRLVYFIASFILPVVLGIIGFMAFILEKDPSSEWANKPDTNNHYQEIIFHAAFGFFGTYIVMNIIENILYNIPTFILFYVLFSATYYTLYGLLHRNFKLKTPQTITIVFVIFGNLLVAIIFRLIQIGVAMMYLEVMPTK